jgi:hypothetical protein
LAALVSAKPFLRSRVAVPTVEAGGLTAALSLLPSV